jgi:putative DNA primase/helicase
MITNGSNVPPINPDLLALQKILKSAGQDAVLETTLANIYVDRYANTMRYCHGWGFWLQWDGSRWKRDQKRIAFDYIRRIIEVENATRKAGPAKASTARGVEQYVQANPQLATVPDDWDTDPWLCACPGGTIDLRSGDLRPSRPDDLITKSFAVTPAPVGTETPRWSQFLTEATQGDIELIAYLQRLAGYCLTGVTTEQMFAFFYGDGGNGKGTFINLLSWLLGDYAVTSATSTFTETRHEAHPTDLAMLCGSRLVTAQETEAGKRWKEARIKSLTGGDRITAHFMRQDDFTFDPTFKLLISGNNKPNLKSVDAAIRRRVHMILFTNRPEQPDPQLRDKLQAEASGILRWCIEGCLEWQTEGLRPPAVVLDATEAYFADQDSFGQWLEEKCDTGPNKGGATEVLFNSWRSWAEHNGEEPGTVKDFKAEMEKRGFEYSKKVKTPEGEKRGYRGLWLKPVDTSDQYQNRGDR